jgi:hypothetical protein
MAALPTPVDPVSAVPSLSLVPPLAPLPSPAPSASSDEPDPVRPRFRRLVVFTGRIS